jgi:hypothetical protein
MLDSEPMQRLELDEEDRKPEIQSTERLEMEGSPASELSGNMLAMKEKGRNLGDPYQQTSGRALKQRK